MANLKELKIRISSVKSTQKITKAMKMVAAAKLRRAQEQAESARPYSERMEQMLQGLAASIGMSDGAPALLAGTGQDRSHLFVVISSHRGLCGGFNGTLVRALRHEIDSLIAQKKRVKLLCIGKKARDLLRPGYGSLMMKLPTGMDLIGKDKPSFADAQSISELIISEFDAGEFDKCTVVYNRFISAISQKVTLQQLIPFSAEADDEVVKPATAANTSYEYEPDERSVLSDLLPRNLSVQCYHALLESAASEHGARMTAMENATRNAGDMIKKLTLLYNRTRQAAITTELVEIISGAEAL